MPDQPSTRPGPTASTSGQQGVGRGLPVLLSVVAGAAVGNLYWGQPLLHLIADDLGVPAGAAALSVTASQVAYAVGILLVVPLGDVLDRRRMIPVLLLCSVVALVGCAVAPTFGALLAASAALGLTTVAGQIIPPLAGDLADDASRGRVVATVMAGFLAGTLVPRTISGSVAQLAGWRAIYVLAAVAAVVLAVLAHRSIPSRPSTSRVDYPALLASVGAIVRRDRTVRWTLVLSALQFGLFTLFWTALTSLLTAEPYSYPVIVIGLFSLLGLGGVLVAQRAGRLFDRGWSLQGLGAGWALALGAFVLLAFAQRSLTILLVGTVLLHVAIFPLNVLVTTRLFAAVPERRSRVNTAMVVSNFVAGAIGSAAVAPLWSTGGWTAVSTAGIALCVAGLAVWAVGRRGPLAASTQQAAGPAHHR